MSMRVSLITLGDPRSLTGGYLYHRRIQQLAPRFGASLSFVSLPEGLLRSTAAAPAGLRRAVSQGHVVVCDSIVAAPLSMALSRRVGVKLVGMLHQPPGGIDGGPLRRFVQRAFDRAAYQRMDHLMVASEALRRDLIGQGFGPEDTTLIEPGCDPPERDGPLEDVGDLRRGSRVAFLCVGNWLARKGLVDLIDAFSAMPEGLACLHLVGNDSVDPSYSRLVRLRLAEPSVRGWVVVHGPVSRRRVDAFYRAADVFVLPSLVEPYGTVYGEAMAAGLPVIGWHAGNLVYLIEEGREGLMNEPGDVPGLAASMLRMARDDELRGKMAAAALARGSLLPTWKDTAAAFFATLHEIRSR